MSPPMRNWRPAESSCLRCKTMKKLIPLIMALLLVGCGAAPEETVPSSQTVPAVAEPVPTEPPDPIAQQMDTMTLEEKVGQMFVIQPESLGIETDPAAVSGELLAQYPVGGFLITGSNISSDGQIRQLIAALQSASEIPLLIATDEEGGTVARFANKKFLNLPKYKSTASVGASGDPEDALEMGRTIGGYLKSYGVNMDLAPVADANTNPQNPIIGKRAFSSDAGTVRDMAASMAEGLREEGIIPTYKHFPGHGDTAQDSHTELAVSEKTVEELRVCEWLPYRGLSSEICVMVAHVALPNVTGNMLPATLSPEIIQGYLRQELGFTGVVLTDGMEMRAIVNHYSDGEAAVLAILAGCDIVLQPDDFLEAYEAVLAAVAEGRISRTRIDESVYRILTLKQTYGLQ